MPTFRKITAALTTLVLALGLAVTSSTTATAAAIPDNLQSQLAHALAQVNAFRVANGKAPLSYSSSISVVAQTWSEKQADAQKMSHNPSFGNQMPSGWSGRAETVARGQADFRAAVVAWQNSPPHKKILLGDYTHVGFGTALASGGPYYTANFGKYSTPPPGSDTLGCPNGLPGRIAGDTRYTTAVEIATVWSCSHSADIVFLATGENYPDALSAAAAAAHLGAPVLLTPKSSLPSAVRNRLITLDPNRVVVLGSSAAISESVVTSVKKIVGSSNVTRIGGTDRYDTMRKIIRYAWQHGSGLQQAPTVVIATGRNFPDALSAGPGAATVGGAVILVDGSASSIPTATRQLISDLNPNRIIIAGSSAAVSSGIQKQLEQTFGAGKVQRVAGSDRFATSRLLVQHFFTAEASVFFATGRNFPDALAGAALAGAIGAPLLVSDKNCVQSATKQLVTAMGAGKRILLGSSAALSDKVAKLTSC